MNKTIPLFIGIMLLAGCGGKYQAITVDLEHDKAIVEAYNSTGHAGIAGDENQAYEVAQQEARRVCRLHERTPLLVSAHCKIADIGCIRYSFLYACSE